MSGKVSSAQSTVRAHGVPIDALVYLGIVCSLGMMAVSALVNFRVGYRAADTNLDGWIYGTGFAFLDLLKAVLPFVFYWGMRQRDWLAVVGSAFAFVLFAGYSITAGMGFAADHRAYREGERTGALEQRADLRKEMTRLEELAVKLGAQRSEQEVANAIEAVFAKPLGRLTVGSASERCTLARRDTREACSEIASLTTELARAKQWADIDSRLKLAREQMEDLGGRGAGRESDPQLAVLTGLLKMTGAPVEPDLVRYSLALLVGLVLEVGSGFGLYLAMTPWRRYDYEAVGETIEPEASEKTNPVEAVQTMVVAATALGPVVEFAVACVEKDDASVLTMTEVFQAYEVWCRRGNFAPLRQAEFQDAFVELAREVGISVRLRGSNISFIGVSLVVDDNNINTASGRSIDS